MEIELYIEGKKETFSTPYVPMMAKRIFMEINVRSEEREKTTTKDLIDEEDEMYRILSSTVFKDQFTTEQMLDGASK